MTDGVTARRIDVGGVSAAYRRAGGGSPLLYLHGSGLTDRWLPLHAVLAERFDVIAPEHPGFASTARPRWYRGFDDIALHHADLLTALGVDRVDVVGHSFGALVAASFAALLPERVRSLTLIAPGPIHIADDAAVEFPEPPEGFDFDSLLFNDRQEDYPDYLDADDEGDLFADDDADPEPAAAITGPPAVLRRRIARYRGPAQVLVPDEDRLFAEEVFQEWSRRLGGAPIVRIEGRTNPTGHLLVAQEPEEIAAVIPPRS